MSKQLCEIRFNLRGSKRIEHVPAEDVESTTWAEILRRFAFDSSRVRIIVDGVLIRDMNGLICVKSPSNRVNVLLLPEKDYSPTQFLNVANECDVSCDGVNVDDNVTRTSKHSLSIASETVLDFKSSESVEEELSIGDPSCGGGPRILNFRAGPLRFHTQCYGNNITLREAAECLE